jgi:exonuclease III
MKLLVWNCRGMRKPAAVRALLGIQERVKPDVLFLSETHLDKAKAGKLKRRLGFDKMEVWESDGRSGGLLMFWQEELGVSSVEARANSIDLRIKETSGAGWRFTGFYGEPSGDRKHLSWDYMRELHAMVDLPWIMVGDFNEISHIHEKEGGAARPLRSMQAFSNALNDCGLDDLGYTGDLFTWRRGRLRERLDRAAANSAWADMFPGYGSIQRAVQ